MVNYNNGKIYKIEPICDHDEGEIYIGSTTKQYLCQRMDTHRSNYKQWKNGNYRKVRVFEIFDKYTIEQCQIVLIETVNAESKDELLAREKHYIKSIKCINKNIPRRTKEETQLKEKEYRENHKEEINFKLKKYYENHKEEIKLKAKIYREANLEKNYAKNVCPCGGSYTNAHQSDHFKSIKHQEYLKSQKDV